MTLIDFGDFKLRFDPKEVRISIDGEIIDVGAKSEDKILDLENGMFIDIKTQRKFIKEKKSVQK